jgi:hypothetical protein
MTGITHNIEALSNEGLICHVQPRVQFDGEKYENG